MFRTVPLPQTTCLQSLISDNFFTAKRSQWPCQSEDGPPQSRPKAQTNRQGRC
jgi:hypothetical protein